VAVHAVAEEQQPLIGQRQVERPFLDANLEHPAGEDRGGGDGRGLATQRDAPDLRQAAPLEPGCNTGVATAATLLIHVSDTQVPQGGYRHAC
jgi:hypothetical protein